ncbi:DUF3426 domain-containing protein [Marinobacter sp. G11]|uniref:DUF3426 domain-containing protein n=1 Tax=Marinobacter sp. G11 TaxID=2903522 RepID=UPI001E5D31E6|nr:DUF3426 domain-containing protein [Marinobacter sp. G11]MCE0758243.1 DUF3426 domain-containing protein [Marinobacter sp. G11]
MTQSSLQTQCPQCETRFRVTDEQLGVAGGKVRCGSCMNVFNALEHRVTESGTIATPPEEKPQEPADVGFGEDEFVFADNPEEDATEGRYAGSKLTFDEDELSDSFRDVDEPDAPGFRDDSDDHDNHQVDESWAEAMLEEVEPGQEHKPEKEPEPEPEPELLKVEPEPEPAQPRADHEPPLTADDDRVSDPVTSRPAKPFQPDNLYQDLRRDPVSVGGGRGGLRTALWTLVVLVLIGVLVAQVTWFQFDRLSAIPQLRPFYEKGCELAGCQLKPLVDVDAIQSRKLVVRTDPENRTQLIVDAVILNRAGFEQPFPAIALTFSNLNGDVVAQSVFSPDEYLAGEASGLNAMPMETPVRIAISIRDPGRDAVNYNLGFRPASP